MRSEASSANVDIIERSWASRAVVIDSGFKPTISSVTDPCHQLDQHNPHAGKRAAGTANRFVARAGCTGKDAERVSELAADRIENGWITLERIALKGVK